MNSFFLFSSELIVNRILIVSIVVNKIFSSLLNYLIFLSLLVHVQIVADFKEELVKRC